MEKIGRAIMPKSQTLWVYKQGSYFVHTKQNVTPFLFVMGYG